MTKLAAARRSSRVGTLRLRASRPTGSRSRALSRRRCSPRAGRDCCPHPRCSSTPKPGRSCARLRRSSAAPDRDRRRQWRPRSRRWPRARRLALPRDPTLHPPQIDHYQLHAQRREALRRREANAARSASDDRDVAGSKDGRNRRRSVHAPHSSPPPRSARPACRAQGVCSICTKLVSVVTSTLALTWLALDFH